MIGVKMRRWFFARVRRVDPPGVLHRVPAVDRRVVLDARIPTDVGRVRDLAEKILGLVRVHDLVGRHGARLPHPTRLGRLHEAVGDPHRVVRILVLNGVVRPARYVEAPVVAAVDQLPGLLLLLRLAADEVENVRMIGVENDHLGGAARLSARADDARERIKPAHERDGAARDPSTGERLARAPDGGEVRARPRSPLEEHGLGLREIEDRGHGVLDGVDEAGARLLRDRLPVGIVDPQVEPDRGVEAGLLVQEQVGQLVAEGVRLRLVREVAPLASPAREPIDDAADELTHASLTGWRIEVTAEVLRGDDVRRQG